MTKRERVYATVQRNPLDAIPWQFDLTSAVQDKLRKYYQNDDVIEATGDHIVFVVPTGPDGSHGELLDGDLLRNEFGSVWRHNAPDRSVGDWGGLMSYPLASPTLSGYSFPDGAAGGRWPDAARIRGEYPDHFLMAGGFGLFENAWGLCGFENYLSYVLTEPSFVEELTELLAEFSVEVTRQIPRGILDGIRFGDDWGFQDRLMLPPEVWRKTFKRHYAKIYDAASRAGLIVSIHSCGNITELLPDLIEIGVQVVHPLQPEAMDVEYCKREFGADLTFWGGLGSQSTLPTGSRDEVRREVEHRLELFGSGGYILAPAGAAPAETPAENIAAIVEVAESQLST